MISATKFKPKPFTTMEELRERLGMTQKEFADTFDINYQSIRNWESDRNPMVSAAETYLRVISMDPFGVLRILNWEKAVKRVNRMTA